MKSQIEIEDSKKSAKIAVSITLGDDSWIYEIDNIAQYSVSEVKRILGMLKKKKEHHKMDVEKLTDYWIKMSDVKAKQRKIQEMRRTHKLVLMRMDGEVKKTQDEIEKFKEYCKKAPCVYASELKKAEEKLEMVSLKRAACGT